MKRIFFTTILLITVQFTLATNYYVSASNGDDNNNGTSMTTPWKTLAKVNTMSSNFQAGDVISFKRGDIWLGERLFNSNHTSGVVNNPIIYTAYGTGQKPIFDLIIIQTVTWVNEGNNIWSTITGAVARVFKNNVEMLRNPFPDSIPLGSQGTQYYTELTNGGNNTKLFVLSSTNPNNDTYQWTSHNIGIHLPNAQYIQFDNLDCRGGASATVMIKNNAHWTIDNCSIGYNSGYGIIVSYSSDIKILHCNLDSNFTVDQSSLQPGGSGVDHTGCSDGIFIGSGSQNIEIADSYFKNWSHASFSSNTNNINAKISFIKFHNNELTSPDIIYGGRIGYSGYSEDGEYFNNYIHHIAAANQLGGSRNHFHHNIIDTLMDSPLKTSHIGIGVWLQNYNVQIKDNIIENNIIANTDSKGLEIYSINWDFPNQLSGNIIRNNIIYNCGLTENNIAIQFHKDQNGQSIYNNSIENNLIYNSNTTQTCLYQYNGTLSDVETFNSQDSDIQNNIGNNPLFIDAENGDYHLSSDSPAINAGVFPLATSDYDNNTIPFLETLPDIGVYEYQGNSCTGDPVSNISVTIVSSSEVVVNWEGNPNAEVWVYVHELDVTGPHHYATENTYIFTTLEANYTFTVFVQGENNCDEPLSLEFSISSSLSASSQIIDNVKIYPNPATNTLTITQYKGKFKSYNITTMLGKKVASGIISNRLIDIKHLENGVYLIMLFSENQYIIEKIVKQ